MQEELEAHNGVQEVTFGYEFLQNNNTYRVKSLSSGRVKLVSGGYQEGYRGQLAKCKHMETTY